MSRRCADKRHGKEFAYYLDSSHVANWLVTEEAGPRTPTSRDVLAGPLAPNLVSAASWADMADKDFGGITQIQRIRRSISHLTG